MADEGIDRGAQQEELEAALPRLIDRIAQLRSELDESERTVLDEILVSAAVHTEKVQADDIGVNDKQFMKPMSVHMTAPMREQVLALPSRFGITR